MLGTVTTVKIVGLVLCVFTGRALCAGEVVLGVGLPLARDSKLPSLPVFLSMYLGDGAAVLMSGGSLQSQHVKHSTAGERSVLNLSSLLGAAAFSK